MAVPTEAQMIGTYNLSAAEMETVLGIAGVRGDVLLNKLAPYETTPNTLPVGVAARAGAYVLDSAAKVTSVLSYLGNKGFKVFEYLISVKAA